MVADVAELSDAESEGPQLAAVDRLSDDEDAIAPPPPPVAPRKFARAQKRKTLEESRNVAAATQRLRVVIQSNCKCKAVECRAPFRDQSEFNKLLALRLRLWGMGKAQADEEAR